jgi:imidazolonepropionase
VNRYYIATDYGCKAMCDTLFHHCQAATLVPGLGAYGHVQDAAVAVTAGRISWVGAAAQLPGDLRRAARQTLNLGGAWLVPGLIDCHSHLVFAGSRALEFEQRAAGASYAQIALAGGGILRTVAATRDASEQALLATATVPARALCSEGVTTLEIKSGYGLDLETECRQLQVAKALEVPLGVHIERTYLGAHSLPPEYRERRNDYVEMICARVIPRIATERLATAVDVFCETIGFTLAETERVFSAARGAGLAVKVHAEQLSNLGASALAARFGALSADHLEYIDQSGIDAMAAAGTVAVLLPLPFYYLREKQLPPVPALRAARVPMAVASDFNPGTAPIASLRMAMNMACVHFGLTAEEALSGATSVAARALGLQADRGQIAVGQRADLCVWPVDHPRDIVASVGVPVPSAVFVDGSPRRES